MKLERSSFPSDSNKIRADRNFYNAFTKGFRLPAILLTLFVASPRADVAEVPAAGAAPAVPVMAAALLPAVAPAPAAVPAVASAAPARAVPAVLADRARGLSPQVLAMALDAVSCARSRGTSGRDDLLTIIDYTLPSTEPRLWVLDLARGEVLFHELVAHGQGSGENYATRFSNVKDSKQTSLGLFLTGGTYMGGNGYSMKLQGLDRGVNDRAEERHIVMHGAWYVSPEHARRQGRLGRSWGCPALSQEIAPQVIDTIKGGSFVFSYSGTDSWYQTASSSLNACGAAGAGDGMTAKAAQ
ncbi:MAG TPA: murein L,D-transpeptidase catalytic domain family protein [Thermoanaerobaculia bacterium]|nr:murein L,D-transpeptidase catalytic domain family protein [Thermoanaerobaculia bacterium]